MQQVQSKDGTTIAYAVSGQGPPLLLVHGGGSSPDRWKPIAPRFEPDFTVYRVARRGIGGSGDATDYSIARQAEDMAAVIDAIGEPVNVLGHSFGGLCVLEAALLTKNIRRLILYEPPSVPLLPPGFSARLQALLDQGDREGVWLTLNREIVKMPEEEIALQQAQSAHAARLASIHVVVYDAQAHEGYEFDPARFCELNTPVLLLTGGDSPAWVHESAQAIGSALPNSHTVVMAGQQHIAMDTAPDLFVREVTEFFRK